jgi:hypothetical protein
MRPNPEHFQIVFWHYPCSFGISAVMDQSGLKGKAPGKKGKLTFKVIRLPYEQMIDPALDERFKGLQPRKATKAAREKFLKSQIFKETFKLLKRDERAAALKMFEVEFSAAFGETPWHCHIQDIDALCKARRAAEKRKGSPHLYLLTALWDGVFSHMKGDSDREKWLADHWQLDFPDGAAIKKQILKLKLPRKPGSYGVKLTKREKT